MPRVTPAAGASTFGGSSRKRAIAGGCLWGTIGTPPGPFPTTLQLKQVGKKQKAPTKPVTASTKLSSSLGKMSDYPLHLSLKKKLGELSCFGQEQILYTARAPEEKARGESMPSDVPSGRPSYCRHHGLCLLSRPENHASVSLQHSLKPSQIYAQPCYMPLAPAMERL